MKKPAGFRRSVVGTRAEPRVRTLFLSERHSTEIIAGYGPRGAENSGLAQMWALPLRPTRMGVPGKPLSRESRLHFGGVRARWYTSCREDEGVAGGGQQPPCAPQTLLTLVVESVTLGFRSDLPEPPALWTRPGHRSAWAPADPCREHGFVAAPGGACPWVPEVTPRLSHESSGNRPLPASPRSSPSQAPGPCSWSPSPGRRQV